MIVCHKRNHYVFVFVLRGILLMIVCHKRNHYKTNDVRDQSVVQSGSTPAWKRKCAFERASVYVCLRLWLLG